jgi:hypothetical protein
MVRLFAQQPRTPSRRMPARLRQQATPSQCRHESLSILSEDSADSSQAVVLHGELNETSSDAGPPAATDDVSELKRPSRTTMNALSTPRT